MEKAIEVKIQNSVPKVNNCQHCLPCNSCSQAERKQTIPHYFGSRQFGLKSGALIWTHMYNHLALVPGDFTLISPTAFRTRELSSSH